MIMNALFFKFHRASKISRPVLVTWEERRGIQGLVLRIARGFSCGGASHLAHNVSVSLRGQQISLDLHLFLAIIDIYTKNLILLYYLFKHNKVLGIVSSKTPQISHSISTCPIYNSLISLIYEQRQNKISDMITCGVRLKIYTNCAVKIDVFCPKSVQDRPSKIQTRSYCLEFRLAKIGGRPTKFISEATEAVFAQRRRQITRQPG